FNKFEKVAGLFVGLAILSVVLGSLSIAVKNGWFSSKVRYTAHLETADGLHAGTIVQIAGLRVGSVTSVELETNDRVRVNFEVLERFRDKIRDVSQIQVYRPFILSEKVLEISVGTEGREPLQPGADIPVLSSADIMDLLSGKKMSAVLASFDRLAESLK